MNWKNRVLAICVAGFLPAWAWGQSYGEADRGAAGDESIQAYLRREAERIEAGFGAGLGSRSEWEQARQAYRDEYFYMLGLSPLPEKTPLQATRTGSLTGDGFVVEMIHYQSRPGLYVTGNLYRPAVQREGERLPAVLYVCGHSSRGRNGNKTAYQAHGIWLARHGYLCLHDRHAAIGRNRGDPSRHLSRGAMVVVLAGLYAGGSRVLERHSRD